MLSGFFAGIIYAYLGIVVLLIAQEQFEAVVGDGTALKLLAALVFPVSTPLALAVWWWHDRRNECDLL